MADKLIKILIEAQNNSGDTFKNLIKELKKAENQAKKTAESLDEIGKSQNNNTADSKKNTAETKKNTDALNNNGKAVKDNSKSFDSLKTGILGSVTAMAAFLTVVLTMAKNATEANRELQLLARNAGLNREEFSKLSLVYKNFGIGAENVASAIKDIAERVNDAAFNNAGEFIDIGKQLGLDAKSLANLPIEQLSERVISEIVKIDNAATRTSFADRLGSDALIQIVNTRKDLGEEFDKIQQRFNKLNLKISEEDSRKLNELNTEFNLLAETLNIVNQELVSEFSPALKENIRGFVDWIAKLRDGRSEIFELIKSYGTFLSLTGEDIAVDFELILAKANLGFQSVLGNEKDLIKASKEVNDLIGDKRRIEQEQVLNIIQAQANQEEVRLKNLREQGKELNKQQLALIQLNEELKKDNPSVSYITGLQKLLEGNSKIAESARKTQIYKLSEIKVEQESAKVDLKNPVIKSIKDPKLDPNSLKVIDASKENAKLLLGKTEIEIKKLDLQESKKQFGIEYSGFLSNIQNTIDKNKASFVVYDNKGFVDIEKSNKIIENTKLKLKEIQEQSKEGLSNKIFEDTQNVFKDLEKQGVSPAPLKKLNEQFEKGLSDFKNIEKGFELKTLDLSIEETQKKSDLFFKQYELGVGSLGNAQQEFNKLLDITKQRFGENSIEYKNLLLQQTEISNQFFQKQIDNLNYLRDTNQITIDEQIAGFEKLRNQVSKNSQQFKDITLTIQQLKDVRFEENLNKLNLQYRLNEKSLDDLIAAYDEQLVGLEDNSIKTLELKAARQDLIDQKISEDFQKLDLQMQLHEATIDDVIAKYQALVAATPEGSLANLQARVGLQGAQETKTGEQEAFIQAQLDSENISYERRNQLLTEYQNLLIQQRETLPENTAEYVNLTNQINALNSQFSVLGVTYGEIADSISNAGTDAFMSWIEGSKSLKDAFKGMAQSIIQDFIQMTIRAMIYNAIAGALGMPTGGMGAGGGIGSLSSLFSGATTSLPTRHNEGPVSTAGDARNSFKKINLLQPSKSLSSDERLIIAKTDEYVTRSPSVNSPTGVGSNTVVSPNLNIQNYITDRSMADIFANSDHLQDTIINIINRNQDKIIR